MSENAHTKDQLVELQAMPLLAKELLTKARIEEWCNGFFGYAPEECTCVSFSGGKDSTVLLHQVRKYFPNVRAVFSDTGLEYPEIRQFVKTFGNVDIVRPRMRFDEVISTYGYPLISKEVAEAIYYARRIRLQSGNVERERERETQSKPASASRTTHRKRTEILGYRPRPSGNEWKWGGRTTSSRRVRRETEERSSKDDGNPG